MLAFVLIVSYQFCRYSAQASSSTRSFQRPGHSKPARPSPWGRNKKLARARSVDGIDYLEFESKAPKDQPKQPAPEDNTLPDSTTDLDDYDGGMDDLGAATPTRNDHNPSHLSVSDLGTVTLRPPGTIPIPLLTVHCFYSLHEHIRERAPPSLA